VISAGWENAHYVDAVPRGLRFAIPTFFNTLPPDVHRYGEGGTTVHASRPLFAPTRPFVAGDQVSRARALYESGILPQSQQVFLNFKHFWGALLSPPGAD